MSFKKNMSFVNHITYVCWLYELYELCKLHEYFYESFKII